MAGPLSFEIQTVSRHKLYSSIVDQLVDGIRSGAFPSGASLPAERLLAAQLGVSRTSLREAIRVLEHAGVLDVRIGSGTFVAEAGVSKVALLRARATLAGDHDPLDLIAARRVFEPQVATLAAVSRKPTDIETLRQATLAHARVIEDAEDPEEIDFAFHLALAAATHNPVLLELTEQIVDLMRELTWRELKHRTLTNRAELYLQQHRTILRAVERADAVEAGIAMRDHLDTIESSLLSELGTEPESL